MLHPDAVFWPIRGIARLAGRSESYQRIASCSMTTGLWEEMAFQAAMVVVSMPNAVSAVIERNPGSLEALTDNTVLLDHEHLLLDHDLLVVPIDLLDEPSIQSAVQFIADGYHLQLPKHRTVAGLSHALLKDTSPVQAS